VPQPLGLLVENHGEGAQAREIRLGIVPAGDLVLAIEEGRHALVSAGELAHHVRTADIAIVEGLITRQGLHLELDRVVVGETRSAQ